MQTLSATIAISAQAPPYSCLIFSLSANATLQCLHLLHNPGSSQDQKVQNDYLPASPIPFQTLQRSLIEYPKYIYIYIQYNIYTEYIYICNEKLHDIPAALALLKPIKCYVNAAHHLLTFVDVVTNCEQRKASHAQVLWTWFVAAGLPSQYAQLSTCLRLHPDPVQWDWVWVWN